jgi:hypothetical protein
MKNEADSQDRPESQKDNEYGQRERGLTPSEHDLAEQTSQGGDCRSKAQAMMLSVSPRHCGIFLQKSFGPLPTASRGRSFSPNASPGKARRNGEPADATLEQESLRLLKPVYHLR